MSRETRRGLLKRTAGLTAGAAGLSAVGTVGADETDKAFEKNDRVSPIVYTNTYAYADPDSYVMGAVGTSIAGYVQDGPSTHEGIDYYLVEYNNGVKGWTSETNITTSELDYIPKVPYFHQYNNDIDPSGTCGNTSVAMLLDFYGVSITPDDLSYRFGDAQSTRPPGASEAFNTIAAEQGLDTRVFGTSSATMEQVKRWIDDGRPVITWGWFTPPGHIVVTLGYDSEGYTVNDPAGDWNGQYQGTHYGSNGEYIRYDKDLFENVVIMGDGRVDAVVAEPGEMRSQSGEASTSGVGGLFEMFR
jgi:hypothetical protein